MKHKLSVSVFGFIFSIYILLAYPAICQSAASFKAAVSSVIDCNTLIVNKAGAKLTIKLSGIAPPLPNQPYSVNAKKFLEKNLLNNSVTVIPEGTDKNGVISAYVEAIFNNRMRPVNQTMIKEKICWSQTEHISYLKQQEEVTKQNKQLEAQRKIKEKEEQERLKKIEARNKENEEYAREAEERMKKYWAEHPQEFLVMKQNEQLAAERKKKEATENANDKLRKALEPQEGDSERVRYIKEMDKRCDNQCQQYYKYEGGIWENCLQSCQSHYGIW